ncbi:MAG: aldo/keto reductase [Myxococcota bacterium]|jgi:aryl-alcohol dehydrogenase-like predicted oxidoreductase|nr:aldo/keto reductase [Myxococcota bacterium]
MAKTEDAADPHDESSRPVVDRSIRRPLGSTGLVANVLGLGAGPLGDARHDEHAMTRLIHEALDLGVELFDTAPSYGLSEDRLGRALAGRRERVIVSTKVGYGVPGEADWTGRCIERGIDLARERLRVDVIDVVHLHSCDSQTLRRADVRDALLSAREAGKVRHLGYSGDGEPLAEARRWSELSVVQTSFNLVDQHARDGADNRAWLGKRTLMNAAFAREAPLSPDVAEYRRRWCEADWPDEVRRDPARAALRFAAFGGPDVVLVGTARVENLRVAVAAIEEGPLPAELHVALVEIATRHAWPGLV